jgi:hypothetical protein
MVRKSGAQGVVVDVSMAWNTYSMVLSCYHDQENF